MMSRLFMVFVIIGSALLSSCDRGMYECMTWKNVDPVGVFTFDLQQSNSAFIDIFLSDYAEANELRFSSTLRENWELDSQGNKIGKRDRLVGIMCNDRVAFEFDNALDKRTIQVIAFSKDMGFEAATADLRRALSDYDYQIEVKEEVPRTLY